MYRLFGEPGWGSAIVEAQLAWYGLLYETVDVGDLLRSEEARARMAPLNPLVQTPALTMPDGSTMTESAAITLRLADLTGSTELVPAPAEPQRAPFLRWLVYLVANLYPTFTYADIPTRFVSDETAAKAFRENIDAYAQRLWRIVEAEAGVPWFLGERFSAIDIYLAVMTHWRPRRPWFAENCPRIFAVAGKTDNLPKLAPCWRRNFAGGNI
jgi:GST-like protein